MSFKKQALALTAAAALLLSACGGSSDGDSPSSGGGSDAPSGKPVSGGTGRIIQTLEPRSLDPALIGNTWANASIVGNALYGQLMIDDPKTSEVTYRIAKDFVTDDGGSTFTLTLRDDVKFSDGSLLTATDVKATWDHAKDPATASVDFPQATQVKEIAVVDDTTLKIELVNPTPKFANSIMQTGLNWIISAASIASGSKGMDAKPIGAGPYTLEKFARQDVIILNRNDTYYGEKPYLDKLEVRIAGDADQRFNTLQSGGADFSSEGQAVNLAKAKDAGLQNGQLDIGGGLMLSLNNTKAPFDDVRARQALALALDLDQINDAVNQGKGTIPTTLFSKSSPFYSDIPLLGKKDPAKAQKLLDELAADGKPLEFSMSLFPTGVALGNSIQTQLSTLKNVKVEVKTIDIANYGTIMATKDYDIVTNSVALPTEPEPRLWAGLRGGSGANFSGVDDEQLNEALDRGLQADDEAERKAAYVDVQKRLVEITPVIFYTGTTVGYIANNNVGGIERYGLGSVLPESLWIKK